MRFNLQGSIVKKLFISVILLASVTTLANPYKSDFVEVSIEIQEGRSTFKLICQPKLSVGELPKNWVNYCNGIGKKLLELAVDKGMEVVVVDKVFGIAGDFVEKASEELPKNVVPQAIISREFGKI